METELQYLTNAAVKQNVLESGLRIGALLADVKLDTRLHEDNSSHSAQSNDQAEAIRSARAQAFYPCPRFLLHQEILVCMRLKRLCSALEVGSIVEAMKPTASQGQNSEDQLQL
jgi:hypothetical protein